MRVFTVSLNCPVCINFETITYISVCVFEFLYFSAGYQLSNSALSAIILRYHNKKGTIPFDIFIQILVRVIVMFGKFGNIILAFEIVTTESY